MIKILKIIESANEFIMKKTEGNSLNTKKGGGEVKKKEITRGHDKTLIVRDLVFIFILFH